MTAPTSLTGFTNQKTPQNGGMFTAPKSVRDIAGHGSTRQDSDLISTVLEITAKEHRHEEIGNCNSDGNTDFVSTILLIPRLDVNGSTECNTRPAEGYYHHIDSNHQTSYMYASDPSNNITSSEENVHWLAPQRPVPTYLITESPGCTDSDLVGDPGILAAKVSRSRSSKRNGWRSRARYRHNSNSGRKIELHVSVVISMSRT